MTLEKRWASAIRRIGGAQGLLDLPESVKAVLMATHDLETKVKLLELVADRLELLR